MDKIFFLLAMVSLVGVVISLVWGVVVMAKGTTAKDGQSSNKMMRLRVLFQGLTLLFLFLAYLAK